jgi:ion channel POLLUX/CASTOR
VGMAIERGFRAKLRYKSDQFLSSGAGKQLFLLFVLTMIVVVFHVIVATVLAGPTAGAGDSFGERFWFFFTRVLDAGTMGGDEGTVLRIVATFDTIIGVIVAGLLISSLAGNFQERLESIKKGGSPVIEDGHFLILGWSEKIFSVIDQLSEANLGKHLTIVVMAEGDKVQMEEELRDKVVHQDRVHLVVRAGSSVSLSDLTKVSFERAAAVVVLVDHKDTEDPNRADGRIIKTLLALYNHPDAKGRAERFRITAEVMLAENKDIALIASSGRAQVVKTNEIVSKIILQTSRITGLSLVYDELLRFEGNEVHFVKAPQLVGRRFGDVLLDFPNGCVVGIAKSTGQGHKLNPPADHVIGPDEELLVLAEDDKIPHVPYQGPLSPAHITAPASGPREKPVEHMLVLGWNEKVFPIVAEFDKYVGAGSTLTMVNAQEVASREAALTAECGELQHVQVRHLVGEFTSRALMERLQPQNYPTVMVLGDAPTAEAADTRAIIALLLLRDFRRRAGIQSQEVCSEILDPKNRELAATTEIHDIVISNETVSMVLAQVTQEPRVGPILEDFFESEGSEIYLKDIALYVTPGQPTTFEHLILAAMSRNELALGLQSTTEDPASRYGIALNPKQRQATWVPKAGDRLIVMAEDDG